MVVMNNILEFDLAYAACAIVKHQVYSPVAIHSLP